MKFDNCKSVLLILAKVALVLTLTEVSSHASVIYSFVGTAPAVSDYPEQGVSFQLTVPDFITQPADIGFSCSQLDYASPNCLEVFLPPDQVVFLATDYVAYYFYFPDGAFDNSGVYTTVPDSLLGGLTVTQTPEPSTFLLVLSSVSLLGLCQIVRTMKTRYLVLAKFSID